MEALKKTTSLKTVLITGAVGIIGIASAFLMPDKPNQILSEKTEHFLANKENPSQQFVVNCERDTVIIFETGSKITIPKDAFIDGFGNPVSGNVDLSYREFHNLGEILLGGTTMRYDSAGVEYNFESAGQFEIGASQNNKPVFIKNDKVLEVALASLDINNSKFNQYYFDKKTNKWIYTEKDHVNTLEVKEDLENPVAVKTENKKELIKQKLMVPKKADPEKQQLTIEVPQGLFPEIEVFKNVIFEVSPKNKSFDPEMAKRNWLDVTLERLEKSNDYKITFIGTTEKWGGKNYEVIAYPVFDTTNYDAAISKYNSFNANYTKNLKEITTKQAKKEDKLNDQLLQYVDVMNKYRSLVKKNAEFFKAAIETQQVVYRTFQIKQFGIWNSDCPQSMPQGVQLAATYQDENGYPIDVAAIYLVEKGKNALYSFYLGKPISFNPEAENTIIVITKDNTEGEDTKFHFLNWGKDRCVFYAGWSRDEMSIVAHVDRHQFVKALYTGFLSFINPAKFTDKKNWDLDMADKFKSEVIEDFL